MKTAITIIAICEVIRTVQITIDLVVSTMVRKKTIENINKVGDSIADEFTPDKVARAIIDETTKEREE